MTKQMNWGGKRSGAGRKPTIIEGTKRQLIITLTDDEWASLKSLLFTNTRLRGLAILKALKKE